MWRVNFKIVEESYNKVPPYFDGINSIKEIVQVLLEAWPDGASQLDEGGDLPLHYLCTKLYDIEEEDVLLDIARLLIVAYPDSLRQSNQVGKGPLHLAASLSSPALCKLIVSYDDLDLVKLSTRYGHLPIHIACAHNTGIDTVKYLFELFPDSIRVRDGQGCLPIHSLVCGILRVASGGHFN